MPDDKQERADRIADAVSARMRALGHTYQSLAAASVEHDPSGEGLSESGIAKVVQGKVGHPQRRTARTLEAALRWPHGTLARVADGEDPPDVDVGERDVRQRLDDLETAVGPDLSSRLAELEQELANIQATLDAWARLFQRKLE